MPLVVGIEPDNQTGFTDRDISLTNGFGFGLLAQHAGVGWGVWDKLTVEEFRHRILLCNTASSLYDNEELYETLTIEFCQRMKDAEWYCNVPTLDKRAFNVQYKNWLVRLNKIRLQQLERKMNREEE